MNYIKSLDGLRALAVTVVILYHYYFGRNWGFGWMGVQLFFVLSGFLITSILLKSKLAHFRHYLGEFYWRRALRIFPVYFGFLGAVLIVFLLVGFPANFAEVSAYLFSYTYNYLPLIEGYKVDFVFTHFWSLSVEEQFYLFWPFIIYFLNDLQLKRLILFIIIISPLFRFGVYEYLALSDTYELQELGQILYRFTPAQVDAFAFGAAIPIFSLTKKIKPGGWLRFSSILFIGAGLINLLVLNDGQPINWMSFGYENGATTNYQYVWTYTIINFLSSSLLMYLILKQNWLTKIFEWEPIVKVGRISYGMYIFHWPLKSVHYKFLDPYISIPIVSFAIYYIIVFIISYLSFRLFESRFLNFKNLIFRPTNEQANHK